MHIYSFISTPQESRKRARDEKLEPLEENQLFVVDLARDLSRVCQVKHSR